MIRGRLLNQLEFQACASSTWRTTCAPSTSHFRTEPCWRWVEFKLISRKFLETSSGFFCLVASMTNWWKVSWILSTATSQNEFLAFLTIVSHQVGCAVSATGRSITEYRCDDGDWEHGEVVECEYGEYKDCCCDMHCTSHGSMDHYRVVTRNAVKIRIVMMTGIGMRWSSASMVRTHLFRLLGRIHYISERINIEPWTYGRQHMIE